MNPILVALDVPTAEEAVRLANRVGEHVAACDLLTAPYGPMDDHWFSPLKVAEYLAAGKKLAAEFS